MPSAESADLLSLFVSPLNRLAVTYMVTGSVAAGMYGEPRLTNDVDLVIALTTADPERLHDAFHPEAFYIPPLEVIREERLRARHGHFNIIHQGSAYKADVYLAGDDPLHEWGLQRRVCLTIDREAIWVAPPEYVILRKLQFFREGGSVKHIADVQKMTAVLGPRLDLETLRHQVEALGLRAEWDRANAPTRQ